MNLLDLPLEILRAVLARVVAGLGPLNSVGLLQVCRIFYAETLMAFETTRVLYIPTDRPSSRQRALSRALNNRDPDGVNIIPLLSRFMSMRPYCYRQPCHGNMSAFLNHILDELKVEPSRRFQALVTLCTQINDHIRVGLWRTRQAGSKVILQKLAEPLIDVSYESNFERHLLPAAILLRLPHIYEPIFQSHIDQGSTVVFNCEYLGTPVYAAIRSHQPQLIPRLLAAKSVAYNSVLAKSHPLDAAVSVDDISMLEMILNDQKFPKPKLETAITRCAMTGKAAPIALLVSHATKNDIPIERALEHALRHACLADCIEVISILLDQAPLANGSFVRPGFTQLPNEFNLCLLDEVVSQRELRAFKTLINHGIRPDHLTLATAVVSGHLGIVQMIQPMVDATHPQSLEPPCQWPQILSSLIKRWACDSSEVLRFLLEKAKVIDIATGFASQPALYGSPMHAACSYGNLEAFEILIRAGMPFDEPLHQRRNRNNYRQTEYWTPMMVALTSVKGQELIIPRLIELGVKPMAGYNTSAWMAFQLGYYPRTLKAIPRENGFIFDLADHEIDDLNDRRKLRDEIDRWADRRENEDGIFLVSSKRPCRGSRYDPRNE